MNFTIINLLWPHQALFGIVLKKGMELKMKTEHRSIFADSRQMKNLAKESVDLIVTSPPYPMIQMWDKFMGSGMLRPAHM